MFFYFICTDNDMQQIDVTLSEDELLMCENINAPLVGSFISETTNSSQVSIWTQQFLHFYLLTS